MTKVVIDPRDYTRGVKRTAKDFRRALRRALTVDVAGTAEAFDEMFRTDIPAVLSHLAMGYEAVNAIGLHRSDAKPPQLEQAYFLLHEALNLVVVALRNLKGGSILASDGVLRQAFESAAVGFALARDATGDLLRKFVGDRWRHADLTMSINVAKALYDTDWVGRLYGFLTNSAAHPSLTHVSHSVSSNGGEGNRIKVTAWFDPKEGSRYKLGIIRIEKTAIFVSATAEAALLPLIERPRFWADTPGGPRWSKNPMVEQRLATAEDERRRIEEPFPTVYEWAEPKDREEVQRLLGATEGELLRDVQRLQQLVTTAPDSFVARYLLAAAVEQKGDFEAAIREFEAAWRLRPNGYDVWSRLEALYRGLGDRARREAFYLRSIECDPEHYEAVHNLGMLYFSEERFEEALTRFQKAHEIHPTRYWAIHNGARTLVMLGRYKAAIACYQHAIERDPETPEPWHNIGVAHVHLGQWNEAYRAFRRAISLDSGFFASWVNLASVCRKLQRPLRALVCALRAEKLAPGDERLAGLVRELRREYGAGYT